MSTLGGPNVVTNGLVLYLDAANVKSYPLKFNITKEIVILE
jgi:hypothetical protein